MLVISNAKAGGNEEAHLRAATAELAVAGAEGVEVGYSETPDEMDELLDRGHEILIVAGGDGSLHALANALYRRGELAERTVGLIPLGTGNDFARSLGIPLQAEAAAKAFLTGGTRALDLFVDDAGEVTVNAVHLGTGADSSREAARWKRSLGPVSFPVGGLIAGWAAQGYRMRVEADGRTVIGPQHKVLMVGLANGRFIGGGAGTLDPDARVDNGVINLVISRSRGLWRRVAHGVRLHRGTHPMEIDVHRHRAQSVSIRSEPVTASNDGEITEGVTGRTWRVLPGAWNFVVPKPD
ncbi:YegS/Rv2252/BmrU family lipid kinase [Spinactinospora alkalitolerans]|uniref:YegS/Rv2252/BmrU family lipid kinase n=1 Tax=Spinactinospora alkalitolerans TaxID=687207 RepID=A0A852TZB5_9ACTN|nr:diacylglycerol kinase family protein [Spinactinospora alkalitolerans]NYE49151.1 YegS/Rv2252/BmrU family lipid kinase [Spinactinospora alkalitolerans]